MAESNSNPAELLSDPAAATRKRPGLFSVTRTGILLILIGHLLACLMVWWLMPGGWPWISIQTFAYRVLPIAIASLITCSLLSRNESVRTVCIDLLRNLWLAMAVLCAVEFTGSFLKVGIGAGFVFVVMLLASTSRPARIGRRGALALLALAFAVAWPVRSVLHSPAVTTTPMGGVLTEVATLQPTHSSIRVGELARLDPTQANVTFSVGRRFIQIEPVLTFIQRSPDATWTIFASRDSRIPPERVFNGVGSVADGIIAKYADIDRGTQIAEDELSVFSVDARSFRIEATAEVKRPVYTHLNTFTQITIGGHKSLFMSFSPFPDQRFEVTFADYPSGAPATFAYVGEDRRLHVVRASSGEKGPFHELAVGAIDGPLTLSFFDGEERFFDCDLADFSSQVSTELSPAAGWGVPQNAIEFRRISEDPKSPATVFITLAATGVGRGWSSVGHSAGVYRNRMKIRLPDNKSVP